MRFLIFVIIFQFFTINLTPSDSLSIPRKKRRKKRRKKKKKKKVWNHTPKLLKLVKRIYKPKRGMDKLCLARLKAKRIKFILLDNVKGVKTPVKLRTNKLGGVVYRRAWNNKTAPWILDCKMVENLIIAGKYIRKYGIASVYWTSAWRYSLVHGKKVLSKHASGLALDITALDGGFGYAALINHWERGCSGCGRGCRTKKGRALRAFICALKGKGRLFKTVYTPSYDARHKDHYHIDGPSQKYKLKVKINKNVSYGNNSKNTHSNDSKSKNGKRNHWQKNSGKRKWEPPRSRPPHY
jgi:hypothetical protein